MQERIKVRDKALYQAYQNNQEIQIKNSNRTAENAYAKELAQEIFDANFNFNFIFLNPTFL